MPQVKPSTTERVPISVGPHVLTLAEVVEHVADNPYFDMNKPEGGLNTKQRTRLIWRFRSDAGDGEGNPYEYSHWTGTTYGDSRANLTWLLDQLLPDSDEEMRANINTDVLIGRKFRTKIQNRKNQKGEMVPGALFFEPVEEIPT